MTPEELLKEVGEPVGYLHQWIEYHPYGDTVAGEPCSAITNDGKPFDKSDTVTLLFTSDQLAAALLKATKPLIEEIGGWKKDQKENMDIIFKQQGEINELRAQLAKAEQRVAEWQPIETAPKDGRELILLLTPSNWPQVAYSNTWWQSGFSVENKPTHWMPLPKAPNGASS